MQHNGVGGGDKVASAVIRAGLRILGGLGVEYGVAPVPVLQPPPVRVACPAQGHPIGIWQRGTGPQPSWEVGVGGCTLHDRTRQDPQTKPAPVKVWPAAMQQLLEVPFCRTLVQLLAAIVAPQSRY